MKSGSSGNTILNEPKNKKELANSKNLKKWLPVDWYNGGMEHTTLHLLYSRFWHKFLFDIGVVPTAEPYARRRSHGVVLAEDGQKMSKSRGNVINPDDMVEAVGADALRLYEMFMGPFDQAIAWSTDNIVGVRRFLEKVWRLQEKVTDSKDGAIVLMDTTVKKVGEDIETMKFNTAISALMIVTNQLEKESKISKDTYKILLILLAPFAPHIVEELWNKIGNSDSVLDQKWPTYKDIVKTTITIAIQINGKVRATIDVSVDENEEEVKEKALSNDVVQKWTEGKDIKKVIYIKGKIISIVIN